jgi:hypothetical protein
MGRHSRIVVALGVAVSSAATAEPPTQPIGFTQATSPGYVSDSLGTLPPGMTDAMPPRHDTGRDTDRFMIGAGFGVFANYPVSIEDQGAALFGARPLWLGNRYRFFQWVAEVNAMVGFGANKMHAYAAAGPRFGFNLYLGSVFGLEFRWGIEGIAQVGARTVGGLALSSGGGYVFRFWDDDRRRIKLWGEFHTGFYVAEDAANDLAMNAGAFVLGLGFEEPL